ncbi:MAG: ABC transporter permease subunit [Thermodesulfovibrionales bacterium]
MVLEIAGVTFNGGVRDRVFITLVIVSILCFVVLVPSVSSLSMRQVREVAVSLSLSIISFVALILTVFLGVNLVYRDIERRFAHSVISLPVSREKYIFGKFIGLFSIIGSGLIIMSVFSVIGITIASKLYQSDIPMLWGYFTAAVFFEFIMLIIISSISIFFSSFSTNLFLPLFATIGAYIIGNVTQPVMDYINSPYGQKVPVSIVYISKLAYYIFPNLSAFDLKFNAIYSRPVSPMYMVTAIAYAALYIIIVLGLSMLIFRRRELL